jgi:hypothetical protein
VNAPQRAASALGVLFAVSAASSVGRADDSVAAQALFDEAKKLVAAHAYGEACPKFEESLRLEPAVGTLLNLADCYERQGRLATAWVKYIEVSAKARAAGQTERARIGRERAAALVPKLSNLVILVPEGSRLDGLEVQRDGARVGPAEWGTPVPTDPGIHAVSASAPGRKAWSQSVTMTEAGKTSTVVVPELAPLPPAPKAEKTKPPEGVNRLATTPAVPAGPWPGPSDRGLALQKILAIVSAGIGVAGVGVGSYAGLMAISKKNDASRLCDTSQGTCPRDKLIDANALEADSRQWGNASTAAFIGGGVGLAGAAVLWFTARKSEQSPAASAELRVGPTTIQLAGTW